MTSITVFTCQQCGKKFEAPPYPKRRFCSIACTAKFNKDNALSSKQSRICPTCGVEFGLDMKPIDVSRVTFCSVTCWKLSRSEERICPVCKQTFTSNKSRSKMYCSRECSSKDRSVKETRKCPGCGVEFSCRKKSRQIYCSNVCADTHRKPRPKLQVVNSKCHWCGSYFESYPSENKKFCSRECYEACRPKTGSITRTNKRRGKNWSRQSRLALERDGYKCQICFKKLGVRKWDYGIHHIKPFRLFNGDYETANQLSNLISLCSHCHAMVELGEIPCPRPLL